MNQSVTETKTTKGLCPHCGAERQANILGEHIHRKDDDRSPVWWRGTYSILSCRGCETVYFRCTKFFSEDDEEEISYWPPISKREKPLWCDKLSDANLRGLFGDVYTAMNNDLHVLAAIGIRTAFDRASELLGVDPSLAFREKLNNLVTTGQIGAKEQDALNILIDAGSAAAHRGWKPGPEELNILMSILESFLYRIVLQPEVLTVKAKVPPKLKKSSRTGKKP
jgi:hypothetical protein